MEGKSSYFQTLRIIHGALLMGTILFLALVRFVFLHESEIDAASVDDPLLFALPAGLLAVGVFGGWWFFNNTLKVARQAPNLTQKLTHYQGGLIIRWASLEAPILFATIWFMLYADKSFMAIALVGMALLAIARPRPDAAARDLQLSDEDKQTISEHGF